jgi:Xaa-Pro aminopeptidase
VDAAAQGLIDAQNKAQALFDEVVRLGLIRPGKLESELTDEIHALARSRFGLKRHWHQRIVRTGPNTLLTYGDDSEDLRIGDDDTVYLDFGPVFDAWEADFGRTYVLGADPGKIRLTRNLTQAFQQGRTLFQNTAALTAGELYDFVAGLAAPLGWEFGATSAGHPVGRFPHKQGRRDSPPLMICHGNPTPLREPDEFGNTRHWILEIHFVDRARRFGGFLEELLTLDTRV